MLDIEIMIFNKGEHLASQVHQTIERLTILFCG